MIKILSIFLSIIYYIAFGLCLLIFHPLQWLGLKIGGYNCHKLVVDYFNFFIMKSLLIINTKVKFENEQDIPENTPLIIVSNHQSMQDIAPLSWYFRKFHPKFISKIELGKGIPSISFNLRHGGSVLIDRKDSKQSLNAIMNFAKYIEKNKFAAVLFPEGTRSRNGVPKRFSENGFKMMVKYTPSAYVVPVTINNSWKTLMYGKFPLKIGNTITIKVHKPILAKSLNFSELFLEVENSIKKDVIL